MSDDVAFLFLVAKFQEGKAWRAAAHSGTGSKYTPVSQPVVRFKGSDTSHQTKSFYITLVDDIVLRPISVGNSNILF